MSTTELAVIPQQDALHVFTAPDAIEPLLIRIRGEIDAFVPDVATVKGRKAIASMAFRVSQTKSYLEGVGKELADEQKSIPKKIDATRKRIRDTLDAWRDEVRAPLTAFEEAEERRVAEHRAIIDALGAAPDPNATAAQMREWIADLEAQPVGENAEEFAAEYATAKDAGLRLRRAALVERERYEAERAELTRLRQEAAEREAREREERIRREAIEQERARAEAEARAQQARAEEAAKAEREAAERRELQLRLDAEAAQRRAAETEQRLRREAEEKEARERAEAARREANKKHRAAINRDAAAAFVAGGLTEDAARIAVTLIAQRAVPAVSISY